MYNTLASSDYGLIDEETYEPRPNYWASLLWKQTMGTRSLDPSLPQTSRMRTYAQCMKDSNGGVSVLLLNLSKTEAETLQAPAEGSLYSLTSPDLLSKTVLLNGQELKVDQDGTVPHLQGRKLQKGRITLPPLSINVLTLPGARNPNCAK
jgi:hypothetical protein